MRMIERGEGNLLDANVEALVNAVNCKGVMGKGIALQFKLAYAENFEQYKQACDAGNVHLGEVLVVPTGKKDNPLCIINFPTKYHWRDRSRLDSIETGLRSLVHAVKRLGIRSIAVPALGCGLGGLDWSDVKPLIQKAFAQVPDVRVVLFEPDSGPQTDGSQGSRANLKERVQEP
jgi:O-acetyl-ADP-ribose deacetylase (regulator of RNase III)